jgi:hypothetical protein
MCLTLSQINPLSRVKNEGLQRLCLGISYHPSFGLVIVQDGGGSVSPNPAQPRFSAEPSPPFTHRTRTLFRSKPPRISKSANREYRSEIDLRAEPFPASPKLSTIESTLTLLGDVRAAETLESDFYLVGLQPTRICHRPA